MADPAYKYTDRDVRELPYLTQIAYTYLDAYQGDFEFLLDAKRIHYQGVLATATIRGVLNCMRADPRWAGYLPIAPSCVSPGLVTPRLRTVNLQRPARIKLNARFKMPYLMSTWPTAQVVHMLNRDRTELWWYPHVLEYRWVPAAYCGGLRWRTNYLMMLHDIPADRRLCLRCVAIYEGGK